MNKIITLLFLIIASNAFAKKAIMRRPGFRDNNNLPSQVIYEVNVRQFTKEGTFKAFAKHIPRLKKMGITTLWFMPIQPIGVKNRKGGLGSYYSISDYTSVNPEFGDVEDFKNVVELAHKSDMKVMIDWVANHCAWDNKWMKTNPEFFEKDSTGKMHSPFDWSDVVELDYSNEGLQDAMIESMSYWVTDCNIDGFRCDVADMVPLKFWMNARNAIDNHKKVIWLSETGGSDFLQAFDMVYGWEWMHALEDFHKGKNNIAQLDSIAQWYIGDYQRGKYRLLFTTNHDENSWNGTEYERYGKQALDMATLTMMMPGVPLIYNGQEEPLKRRLKFFEKDDIGFSKYTLASFYKKLIAERQKYYNQLARGENPVSKITIGKKRNALTVTIGSETKVYKTMIVK
jgi:alpha-amylase